MKQHPLNSFLLAVVAAGSLLLFGCAGSPPADDSDEADGGEAVLPSMQQEDQLHYNLRRLSDQTYTDRYGDGENVKIWYTAAETLGQIGKQAIPALIDRLDSDDEYEVMLALYALQLASQDEGLKADIGGNYLRLPSVLNPRANRQNRAIALSWWDDYQHIWRSQQASDED